MEADLEIGRLQVALLARWTAFRNFEWQMNFYSTVNLLSYCSLIITLTIHMQHIGTLNSSPNCMSNQFTETILAYSGQRIT